MYVFYELTFITLKIEIKLLHFYQYCVCMLFVYVFLSVIDYTHSTFYCPFFENRYPEIRTLFTSIHNLQDDHPLLPVTIKEIREVKTSRESMYFCAK